MCSIDLYMTWMMNGNSNASFDFRKWREKKNNSQTLKQTLNEDKIDSAHLSSNLATHTHTQYGNRLGEQNKL